jgi:hypothetical protein
MVSLGGNADGMLFDPIQPQTGPLSNCSMHRQIRNQLWSVPPLPALAEQK